MRVVPGPSDWNPDEAATSDDGKGMKLVLLSEKNGIATAVDEDVGVDVKLCVVARRDWFVVDCEEESGLSELFCVCDDAGLLPWATPGEVEELEVVEFEVVDTLVSDNEDRVDEG